MNLFFSTILGKDFFERAVTCSRNLSTIVQGGAEPYDAFQRALSP